MACRGVCADLGVTPTDEEVATFASSVGDWPAFPDSAEALAALQRRFKLAVITNCDDDLFAASNRRLGVTFDWIVTAQQVGSYKPSHRNFEAAFERIDRPRDRILHVAQSLYHDHVPARELGLSSVWINRRGDRPGSGATPAAEASPDATFPDMASFAEDALGWPPSRSAVEATPGRRRTSTYGPGVEDPATTSVVDARRHRYRGGLRQWVVSRYARPRPDRRCDEEIGSPPRRTRLPSTSRSPERDLASRRPGGERAGQAGPVLRIAH